MPSQTETGWHMKHDRKMWKISEKYFSFSFSNRENLCNSEICIDITSILMLYVILFARLTFPDKAGTKKMKIGREIRRAIEVYSWRK